MGSIPTPGTISTMDLDQAIQEVEPRPAAYVLRLSGEGTLYKGSARELNRRLRDHRAGRVSHTKNGRPLTLVHFEYFDDHKSARKRENYFKSGAGREWLKKMIED